MKFNIVTFGCKVNYYESESMNQMMLESGYELSESFTDSDIVIINSCTVTAESDRKIRQLINKVKRLLELNCDHRSIAVHLFLTEKNPIFLYQTY